MGQNFPHLKVLLLFEHSCWYRIDVELLYQLINFDVIFCHCIKPLNYIKYIKYQCPLLGIDETGIFP